MRALVIDSHKGTKNEVPQNLHWKNAKTIADLLNAKLIWSYEGVNDSIETDYDVIVLVHASAYDYVDRAWIEKSPNAKLFYVTNEYNLGEPRMLWPVAKAGRKYTVIANHQPEISKIVKKYTNEWIVTNLNCLCYNPVKCDVTVPKPMPVYFGSYRKGRKESYQRYLGSNKTIISTHSSNKDKFSSLFLYGDSTRYCDRINWNKNGLSVFSHSIYLEDSVTHESYNYLANRFYEALNYNKPTLFADNCRATVEKSVYWVPEEFFIESSYFDLHEPVVPKEWHDQAKQEKEQTLKDLKQILSPCYTDLNVAKPTSIDVSTDALLGFSRENKGTEKELLEKNTSRSESGILQEINTVSKIRSYC